MSPIARLLRKCTCGRFDDAQDAYELLGEPGAALRAQDRTLHYWDGTPCTGPVPRDPAEPSHTHAGGAGRVSMRALVECAGCRWEIDRAVAHYAEHPEDRPDWLVEMTRTIEAGPEAYASVDPPSVLPER